MPDYEYEDRLPETMTDAEYDDWYAQSWIEDGVRVGVDHKAAIIAPISGNLASRAGGRSA